MASAEDALVTAAFLACNSDAETVDSSDSA